MQQTEFIKALDHLDRLGFYVLTTGDLRRCFAKEPIKTFKSALSRHVKSGLIEHACRGIYINRRARCRDTYPLEHIAKALRRGKFSYISLESLLSEIGVISQVPIDLLTVMTTGRSQHYDTLYGRVEFVHTNQSTQQILSGTYRSEQRPLKLATRERAIKDLKNVGRNLDLMDLEEDDDD